MDWITGIGWTGYGGDQIRNLHFINENLNNFSPNFDYFINIHVASKIRRRKNHLVVYRHFLKKMWRSITRRYRLVTSSFVIGSIIPTFHHRRDQDVPAWRLMAAEIACTASRMASSDLLSLPDIVHISKKWILHLVEVSGKRGLAWTSRLHWTHQVAWMDAFKTASRTTKHV